MPRFLRLLDKYAFADCRALTSVSLPVTLKRIEDYAFARCVGLHTMLFPDHRVSVGNAVLTGCNSLDVLVLQHLPVGYRRVLDKWDVSRGAQIILYSDLRLAFLFAELTDRNVSKERKQELRQEIESRLEKMRKRNHLSTIEPLRENLRRITQTMEAEDAVETEEKDR